MPVPAIPALSSTRSSTGTTRPWPQLVAGRRMALWLPVCLGTGIWAYFALPAEPPVWAAGLWLVPLALVLTGADGGAASALRPVSGLALAVLAGFALAQWATWRAEAPMLGHRLAATVEGRVIGLSRAASGAPRVLLDRVVIYGREARETPARVRIALLEESRESAPAHGERIRLYALLLPPSGPVEPGAFDFRRQAYFDRIGAVGYARVPYLRVPEAETVPAELARSGPLDRLGTAIGRLRRDIAEALFDRLSGPAGAFAAAILVGDRSAIADADAEALRRSNLAHLLAISGLHMGLVTGLVFFVTRLALSFSHRLATGYPIKKWAALAALAAGVAYLVLSGATVATQRALIMVSVFLVSILCDRPAITLRALALAALIVLALRPVSLFEAGFQMSFAATLALVAGFEELRRRALARAWDPDGRARPRGWWHRLAGAAGLYLGALLLSSLLAGTATAPFAAYHFNRVAPLGLIANLAAVPVMGLWVVPWALVAALAAPFGLAELPLAAMGQGIEWILGVAHWVAGLPWASRPVAAARPEALALFALGGLWLTLVAGRWRVAGLIAIAAAAALWWGAPAPRPVLLVAAEARLVGLMGPEGRVLDRARGQPFAAETWLRRDGDGATQQEAAQRPGLVRDGPWLQGAMGAGWAFRLAGSRRVNRAELRDACRARTLLVAPFVEGIEGDCVFVGRDRLGRTGAFAADLRNGKLRVTPAAAAQRRSWSSRRVPR